MKRFVFILLSVLLPVSLLAEGKLVERSGKRPDWIMKSDSEAFAVSASDADINVARERCLNDIKAYIVNAIASNIVSVEESSTDIENANGVENIYSTYSSELRTAAAKLPFITGISLSNAAGIYWEKYRDKSDGSVYYVYHVLYPFTAEQQGYMIAQFKRYDSQMYDRFLAIKSGYDNIETVGDIDRAVEELKPLQEYFFDSFRKKEVEGLSAAYRKLYGAISIVPVEAAKGSFTYMLLLNGKRIESSRMPSLRGSDAVASLVVKPNGEGNYTVTYDDTYCYPDDDNYIDIVYSFGLSQTRYRHNFNIAEN